MLTATGTLFKPKFIIEQKAVITPKTRAKVITVLERILTHFFSPPIFKEASLRVSVIPEFIGSLFKLITLPSENQSVISVKSLSSNRITTGIYSTFDQVGTSVDSSSVIKTILFKERSIS